jgi:AcrR family transcriptional regulator
VSQKCQRKKSEPRRERERDEIIARIKDVAREMFVKEGYEAVTLQKIADSIEYTRPFLYRYFRDKKEILISVALDDMEPLHSELLKCASIEDPLTRLREMARQNVLWAVAYPNHYLLLYSAAWGKHEDSIRSIADVPLECEPLVLCFKAVEELIERKMVKPRLCDASLIARTLWAAIHGVIMSHITMSGYDKKLIPNLSPSILTCHDTMMDVLMTGFLLDNGSTMEI